jgi:hypothetical protein
MPVRRTEVVHFSDPISHSFDYSSGQSSSTVVLKHVYELMSENTFYLV